MNTNTTKKPPSCPVRGQAHEVVEPLLRKMDLRDTPVDRGDLSRINVEYGKDLTELADLAADTVARCPDPFPDLVAQDVPARIRARNLAIEALRRDRATFVAAAERTQDEIHRLSLEQAEDTRVIEQSVEAILHNPMQRHHHVALSLAARPLRQARQARRDAIRTAIIEGQATRALVDEKDSSLAAAQDEIGRLELENRYLSGEELRPADLPPAARRKARRAPR